MISTHEAPHLALEAENIESRPPLKANAPATLFQGCEVVPGAVAEALFRDGLCLPSGTAMGAGDIERVAGVMRGVRR